MKKISLAIIVVSTICCVSTLRGAECVITDTSASPYARLHSAALDDVQWGPGFWADRFALVRDVTLPHLYELAADPNYGHALSNLRIAGGLEEGRFSGTHWQDAWVYKWLEAAAAVCAITKDPALDARMDEVIAIIAEAQQPDGYIASQITARGWGRFENPHHHELYTMGHLLTAACLHNRITGKSSLLTVAKKTADFLHEQFKDVNPKMAHFPRNPSMIMGAVELYRTTGNRRYLDLANAVIDMRGRFKGGSDLNQDRIPLRREKAVVGHAVFYTYLYSGAADAYMETGDQRLLAALDRLWFDLTRHKMYITGGCCALHRGLSVRNGNIWTADDVHEAAGPAYYLPNSSAYNETCAQVGNFMWNWRMLAITGEARFADVMEREMYNGFLSGISLDGKMFFYSNPLRWYGKNHVLSSNDTQGRHQIGVTKRICCPTNVLRTLAEMRGYFYSTDTNSLWVHHYGANTFENGDFRIVQKTDYPWGGRIDIVVEKAPSGASIHVRIPQWTSVPAVRVNGKAGNAASPDSYVAVSRKWKRGDTITLDFPMDVRLMMAHPKVESARNQIAIMRGPILYCLESVDLPDDVRLSQVLIPRDIELRPHFDASLFGGATVLQGEGQAVAETDWTGTLYQQVPSAKPRTIPIRLIPYYAWANRGLSEMSVWLPVR